MKIQLSDHFDYKRLLRFTLPSIVMMIFTSIYSVVDGLFISNAVGIGEFAAINLIMPILQVLGCIGFMFGSGGSALVAATLGRGDKEKANRIFSMLVYIALAVGTIIAIISFIILEPIAIWLGANDKILPYCLLYGRILLISLPMFIVQMLFQSFLITAEKPTFGLVMTIVAGVTNIVLDALFIFIFKWGLAGAAIATTIAQTVGGVVPLIYFFAKNSSLLRLGRATLDMRSLAETCANGSSEFVTNISMSVVSILYNFQLMRFAKEDGVAAYGAVMYVSFIFVAVFIGYSIGVAPVVSFHYGAKNSDELKSLFKKSQILIAISGVILAILAFMLAEPLAILFVGKEGVLFEMTLKAFRFFSVSTLFTGFNIFASAFFTALNNGVVSAVISFMRTLFFQVISVLLLPIFFEINGVWYSLVVAEALSLIVVIVFYIAQSKKYQYA